MTKPDFTSINVVLDKSGSMGPLRLDTIGGFNTFLADQKALPGEVILTLCTFNNESNMVYECKPLSEIPDLTTETYCPSGGTALLDALGKTINSVGERLAAMRRNDRPSKVIFLVITDGEENCSRDFLKHQIAEMVKHQQDKYSWQFVFMGANIDSIHEGVSMGFSATNTLNYQQTSIGTKGLYREISEGVTRSRKCATNNNSFFSAHTKKL